MKLYSETRASRGGRPARKGDGKELVTKYSLGNTEVYSTVFKPHSFLLIDEKTKTVIHEERFDGQPLTFKGERQKGECSGKHESVDAILKCEDCSKSLDRM